MTESGTIRWKRLLKKHIDSSPSESWLYTTRENIVITITSKKKIRKRHHTFGGPHWCATLDFSNPNELRIEFLSPTRRPYNVKWNEVVGIAFELALCES